MKRLLAAALCALAVGWAPLAHAASGVGVRFDGEVKWRTSAAATVGVVTDSTVFKQNGSANATRDTTAWIDVGDMVGGTQAVTVSDSSLAFNFTLSPLTTCDGTTFGIGADSLYAYVEGTNSIADGPMVRLATNLTEVLAEETNANNAFTFGISWARWALQMSKMRYARIIVRGDLNGCWEGRYAFYTNASNKSR